MTERSLSENDLHVMFGAFLNTAEQVHIAMCRFDDDHAAQAALNNAMRSALNGAEMCRQLHAKRPAPPDKETDR